MAIPGPPAASTPGIGLVKFRLFAEDSNMQKRVGCLVRGVWIDTE